MESVTVFPTQARITRFENFGEAAPDEPTLTVVIGGLRHQRGDAAFAQLSVRLRDRLDGIVDGLLCEQAPRAVVRGAEELPEEGERRSVMVLVGESAGEVLSSLAAVRRDLRCALSPVVVCLGEPASGARLIDPRFVDHADAVLDASSSTTEVAAAVSRVSRIAADLRRLPAPAAASTASHRRLAILRYLLTRGLTRIAPSRDPHAPLGHRYAPFDLVAGACLSGDLDDLCRGGMLAREFFDRVHVCPGCGDARLAFREVCSGCRSSDVRHGGVVHHYRCGHVAPEEGYRSAGALVCPSCGETLRHVGIDYERPAVLLYCNGCGLATGEGVTQARCLSCGESHLAPAVEERRIWSYELTSAGAAAASGGFSLPSIEGDR